MCRSRHRITRVTRALMRGNQLPAPYLTERNEVMVRGAHRPGNRLSIREINVYFKSG